MSSPVLRVSALRHRYGDRDILRIRDWTLETGARHLLSGPSGSGKTTLLSILTGLLKPTEGEVFVGRKSIWDMAAWERDSFRAKHFGIVFQDHHLISSLSLADNLALARQLAGLEPDTGWAAHLLAILDLGHKAAAKPGRLSRGEAQRAALARAAVTRPGILVADEPTSALDDRNAERVLDLLALLGGEMDATILVASHDGRMTPFFTRGLKLEDHAEYQAWS